MIVKRVSGGGGGETNWWTTDSEGIGSSQSFMGKLNSETYFDDSSRIKYAASGFMVRGDLNTNGSSWWYYAIAA